MTKAKRYGKWSNVTGWSYSPLIVSAYEQIIMNPVNQILTITRVAVFKFKPEESVECIAYKGAK